MTGFKKGDIVVRRYDVIMSHAWEIYCKEEGIGLYDPIEVLENCNINNPCITFHASHRWWKKWKGNKECYILYCTQTSIDDWV